MLMRPSIRQMKTSAQRWLALQPKVHAPAELTDLLAKAGAVLIRRFGIPLEDAQDIAMSAWSEISGKESGCHVDLDLSTPHLIWVVDELAGTRRPVPVVDLVRILGPREVVAVPPPKSAA